jgi:hypothetical protein
MPMVARRESAGIGLVPHPGSNPEGHPVPRGRELEFLRRNGVIYPELCYLASRAVGHLVSVYHADATGETAVAFFGFEGPAYQVMRWDESPGRGRAFWDWHLRDRPASVHGSRVTNV